MASLERSVLLRMEGAEAGRPYDVSARTSTIGRSLDNHIVIDDSSISRRHAQVTADRQSATLEDCNSENGVCVNGQRIRRIQLISGDLIELGARVSFVFQRASSAQAGLMHRLYDSSTRDGLTGTYNRKHFWDHLTAEVAFCRRHGTALGLIVVDVDLFRSINDQHGHATGDAVLQHIAKDVARQLRTEDLFARIGGEEFAILLRGIDAEGCLHLAQRLRLSIAAFPVRIDDLTVPVTISLGCASLKGTEVTAQALMMLADQRLCQAKRQGRNSVVAAG